MNTKQPRHMDVHAIERLITAYNRIDGYLRTLLQLDSGSSFSEVLNGYAVRYPSRIRDVGFLRVVADLRNVLSHDRTQQYQHPAVPAGWLVDRLEAVADALENPLRVIPTFQCQVRTLQIHQSLSQVLELIRELGYSQFPVYSGDSFHGLLTENGITRWLARYNQTETILDLADIQVQHAMQEEEKRVDCIFVARGRLVEDVVNEFAGTPTLEAVIITQHGKATEQLLGIVTRWNVLEQRSGTRSP